MINENCIRSNFIYAWYQMINSLLKIWLLFKFCLFVGFFSIIKWRFCIKGRMNNGMRAWKSEIWEKIYKLVKRPIGE